MASFNVLGPLFGLPFVTGSLPHSPQFVLSLAERDEDHQITQVRENRLAPLLCYFMIGLPLLAPSLLQSVPKAAVFGTLIFVGIDGIQSTQLYERCLLMFTDARFVPKRSVFASVSLGTTDFHTDSNRARCGLLDGEYLLWTLFSFVLHELSTLQALPHPMGLQPEGLGNLGSQPR